MKEGGSPLTLLGLASRIKLTDTTKELEQVKQELSEIRRLNSKLNQQVDQYEAQIGELHEQVERASRALKFPCISNGGKDHVSDQRQRF